MGSFDYLLREPAKTATTAKTPATASAEEGICGFRGFCSDETLAPLATDFEERSAIAQFDAGVPREWAEGYASLQCHRVPIGFSSERWMRVITDGGRFLDLWGSCHA